MKAIFTHVMCGVLLLGMPATLTGCQTNQPGVKSTYRSQWTTVDGTTMKATEAAKDVLEDLNLKNIQSTSTAVDGNVTGYTADETKISVDVQRVTDKTSQVSVNVGSMGDPDMGKDIIARIQKKLS